MLNEAKNLEVYKKLLRILGEYVKGVTSSNLGKLFDLALENGVKILPKDKLALSIVDKCLDEDCPVESLQKLSNIRFSNLPIECRPLIKGGEERFSVASWKLGDKVSDRVQNLIDWQAEGGTGKWVDQKGDSVTLLDLSKEEVK
jgi:hypothetical protein